MKSLNNNTFHYLPINDTDLRWGMVCTTVGIQRILPTDQYPMSKHPNKYIFNAQKGRILDEYQLIYITDGSGTFTSASCKSVTISAGTMILLFPGEWHTYYPNKITGWHEHWIGFKGINMDKRVEEHFFDRTSPVFKIGMNAQIINCYKEIIEATREEKMGFQQYITGMLLQILGSVYFLSINQCLSNTPLLNKITHARTLMKENLLSPLTAKQIADRLGIGYTWFRRSFKEYVGISPAQYMLQIRLNKGKELLSTSDLSITEIAYELGYENASQFSVFFRNKEGISPSEYRCKVNKI